MDTTRWEIMQARVTPTEKEVIQQHCKNVLHLPYSVVTRLFWRKRLADYRLMPQLHTGDVSKDIALGTREVMMYLPIMAKSSPDRL